MSHMRLLFFRMGFNYRTNIQDREEPSFILLNFLIQLTFVWLGDVQPWESCPTIGYSIRPIFHRLYQVI